MKSREYYQRYKRVRDKLRRQKPGSGAYLRHPASRLGRAGSLGHQSGECRVGS